MTASQPVGLSPSQPRALSTQRAKEVATPGAAHIGLSTLAGFGCYQGVSYLGNKTEDYVRTHWKTMWTLANSPEIEFQFMPQKGISEERVIKAIQTCISSGERAAVSVGVLEALVQCFHLVNKENTKPWSVNLLEGGYRGAAIGAIAGFTKDSKHPLETMLYTTTATAVGFVLGQTIAGIGHIIRSRENP